MRNLPNIKKEVDMRRSGDNKLLRGEKSNILTPRNDVPLFIMAHGD